MAAVLPHLWGLSSHHPPLALHVDDHGIINSREARQANSTLCFRSMLAVPLALLGTVATSRLVTDVLDDSWRQVFVNVTWADNDTQGT